jgi:thiol-disulfide isomerase/thioredoxin
VPRRAAAVLSAVLALLALTACTDGGGGTDPRDPEVAPIAPDGPTGLIRAVDREPAPTLRGTTLDGEPLDVADLRGKVVVLNFWASWCSPCRAEAKNLVAVAEATRADGVVFVGVNIKDEPTPAKRFDEVNGVPYPSIHDQKGEILLRFRKLVPQSPPTTLILDREGRIAGRFIRPVTETELLGPVQVLARES